MARAAPIDAPSDSFQFDSLWALTAKRLLRHKVALAGLVVIGVIALAAIFAPIISADPNAQDYTVINHGPSFSHWFGTDYLGRDIFSRVVHGARVSLMVGIFTQVIILAIGLPLGALAGYIGGKTDNFLMRFVDIIYAFPDLLFIILLRSVLGGGIFMLFLSIALVSWVDIARLARGQVLVAKEMDYVKAAKALGAPPRWILMKHVLPNSIGPIIVAVTFAVPRAIFIETALSYIGIGVRPPTPSWGSMVQDGYSLIFASPHLVLFPTIAIGLLMMAFTFLGDGLRDALDPRAPLRARTSHRITLSS
ncbi:MAG: ABC transporter permease [SAR202 cluster bacterium]|nr:ABC transporter permease [SAR202 cluster bacterium]